MWANTKPSTHDAGDGHHPLLADGRPVELQRPDGRCCVRAVDDRRRCARQVLLRRSHRGLLDPVHHPGPFGTYSRVEFDAEICRYEPRMTRSDRGSGDRAVSVRSRGHESVSSRSVTRPGSPAPRHLELERRARPSSTSGASSWSVPTRTHGVGGDVAGEAPAVGAARPRQRGGALEAGEVDAQVGHDVDVDGERPRRAASYAGSRSATTMTGAHAAAQRLVAELRHPLVVEHRPRDQRRGVGEGELGEAPVRPVLDAPQLADVALDHERPGSAASPSRHSSNVA